MSTNKSSEYGYYGGVSITNHYVPPEVPDFIPQPRCSPVTYIMIEEEYGHLMSEDNYNLIAEPDPQ